MALQLLNIFEVVHESGYVYNDLKLHNILLDNDVKPAVSRHHNNSHQNIFEKVNLNIIDFGLSTKWIDPSTGKHIDKGWAELFRGNMYFSSVNLLSFKTPSRRDDLCSLAYLVIFMLRQGTIEEFEMIFEQDLPMEQMIRKTLDVKQRNKLTDLCTGQSACLFNFCKEV